MGKDEAEGIDLLQRAMHITAIFLVSLLGIGLLLRFRLPESIVLGGVWSLANLFLLRSLAPLILLAGKKRIWRLISLLFLKFPALYALGALMLAESGLPPFGLIGGFSLPFAVLTGLALFESISRGETATEEGIG